MSQIKHERFRKPRPELAELTRITSRPFRPKTRWAEWESAVLRCVNNPRAAQDLIVERQRELDDDAAERDAIVEIFRERIRRHEGDTQAGRYFIRNALIQEWMALATNDRLAPNRASTKLRMLGIAELRPHRGKERGWIWTGPNAGPNAEIEVLRSL
jgi:hypothetical protein